MKFDDCPDCEKDFDSQNEYDFQFHHACGWNCGEKESKNMSHTFYGLVVGGPMAGRLLEHTHTTFITVEPEQLTFAGLGGTPQARPTNQFVYQFRSDLKVGTGPQQSFNYWIPEGKDIEFVMQELWGAYQQRHGTPGQPIVAISRHGGVE